SLQRRSWRCLEIRARHQHLDQNQSGARLRFLERLLRVRRAGRRSTASRDAGRGQRQLLVAGRAVVPYYERRDELGADLELGQLSESKPVLYHRYLECALAELRQ